MDDTITQQTFFLFIVPIVALLLVTLVVQITSGAFEIVRRRLVGMPDNVQRLERRLARLEAAIVRARASELPIEIEAEHLANEIERFEVKRRDREPTEGASAADGDDVAEAAAPAFKLDAEVSGGVEIESEASAATPVIDLPPDPNESEEDRIAREQLEAEERERIERLAAEEARIRQERKAAEREKRERVKAEAKRRREEQEERDRIERERRAEAERIENEARAEAERIERERREKAERIERERQDQIEREARERQEAIDREKRARLEAEAERKRQEEQRRKAEEFRRRVADATPKIVMSAGGSNREAVTVNIAVTNNLTPKRAEIAVLSSSWAQEPAPARFETQRKDGLYEERWPKQHRNGGTLDWDTYEDAAGRSFDCPAEAPSENHAWIVISYERTVGGAASTWQRFEVGGAGALWYVRQAIGDPIVVEAAREDEAAA